MGLLPDELAIHKAEEQITRAPPGKHLGLGFWRSAVAERCNVGTSMWSNVVGEALARTRAMALGGWHSGGAGVGHDGLGAWGGMAVRRR